MSRYSFSAMNSTFEFVGLTKEQGKRMCKWFRYVENRLSRFHSESELSHLNQSHGEVFLASALLYEVTEMAFHYFLETNQVFHPFLGKAMEMLGYDQSFEKLTMAGEGGSFANGLDDNHPFITFHPGMRAIQLHPEVSLDLGGIAKGWSVHKAQQWLQKEGLEAGLINGGGDLAGWGKSGTWMVRVANPYSPDQDIVDLQMKKDFGIATSNSLKRSWINHRGRRVHHLLDPSTGNSAESDLVQVTMLAPDVLNAEIYAKTLLVLGSEKGSRWLQGMKPDLAYIAVSQQEKVLISDNLHEYADIREGIDCDIASK